MPKEDDLLAMRREIERIKDRIDEISHIQAQQVRADGKVRAALLNYFEGKGAATKIKVYLAVDGRRSLTDIANAIDLVKSRTSVVLQEMLDLGLVGFDDVKGNKVYRKSVIDRALGLTRELEKRAGANTQKGKSKESGDDPPADA